MTELLQQIARVQEHVTKFPADIDAVRTLGILNYRAGEINKAESLLSSANQKQPGDALTICYLGLSYESKGHFHQAITLYQNNLNAISIPSFQEWVSGKIHLLTRRQLRQEFILQLNLSEGELSPVTNANSVLVFPPDYHGDESRYQPLRKGLAEIMINDLRLVGSLEVVDRYSANVLFEEHARYRKKSSRENLTRRMGMIAGSSAILRYAFNIWDDNQIVLDIGYWNTRSQEVQPTMTYMGALQDIFSVQDEAVMAVLRRMKIRVDSETERMIRRIPTVNLDAFLMFSAGLEKEDQGHHQEALIFFEKALELDPAFSECHLKIGENKLLARAQQDPPDHLDLGRLPKPAEHYPVDPVLFY